MKEDPAVREIERFVQSIPEPHPGLRGRVMAAVGSGDRTQGRPGWALAVAVLLAGLIVATLALGVRGIAVRSGPAARPSSGPIPTPASGTLDVPDSTPVIQLESRTAAITWSGESGTLGVAAALDASVYQSPDGSRFLVGSTVYDRRGVAVGDLPSGTYVRPTWADDSRHLCRLGVNGSSQTSAILQLLLPGQKARNVRTIRSTAPSGPGSTVARIEACSLLTDRAVLSQNVPGGKQVSLVRLSSGSVLSTHTYPANPPSTPGGIAGAPNLLASRDASLLAVTSGSFTPDGSGLSTTVLRLSDGSVLAQVPGRVPLGFSWNGDLAVMSSGYGGEPSVVRWRTGEVLWTGGAGNAGLPVAEPNGTHVAVGLVTAAIWIVGPDGQARQVATNDHLPQT